MRSDSLVILYGGVHHRVDLHEGERGWAWYVRGAGMPDAVGWFDDEAGAVGHAFAWIKRGIDGP